MEDLSAYLEDKDKWHAPGWRNEQRYSNGVLIGNWSEERHEFKKGSCVSDSTHRTDFTDIGRHTRPDVTIRRNALARNDGLGRQHLFTHHGNSYSSNMVTLYHDVFNNASQGNSESAQLRTNLRQWDRTKVSWQPEPIDQRVTRRPYRYGLYERLQAKWKKQAELEEKGDYQTSYGLTYHTHDRKSLVTSHYASPRQLSTHLHPHRLNKDLQLRSSVSIPKPEHVPNLSLTEPAPISI
ncbi:cilia- and flagella-associated protein 107-like [Corticium candelabrum]|uniref:cilia- and flagella-associated protein 107-like n=1 Tax=Corticium candelabrum TaxID=121492 RepID=UPI002E2659FD|nr:cilia- and flagella-associated protein 107-like [Corticium candelabrum]